MNAESVNGVRSRTTRFAWRLAACRYAATVNLRLRIVLAVALAVLTMGIASWQANGDGARARLARFVA